MAHNRLRKYVFVLIAIGSIVALPLSTSVSTSVDAAQRSNEQMRVYPAAPDFSRSFFMSVSGEWPNSCVPALQSVDVTTPNEERGEARTPGPQVNCTDTPTDWGFSILIPPRQPNFHTAVVVIKSGITGDTLSTIRHEFEVLGGVQVTPSQPLVNEEVTIRLADLSPDGCVPQYISHEVAEQSVTIDAQIPDLLCGQVPTPWQIDVPLGPLAAGTYQTELFVTDHRQNPPIRRRLLSDSFVVAEQLWYTHLPLWGCFGQDVSPLGCAIVQTPNRHGEKP